MTTVPAEPAAAVRAAAILLVEDESTLAMAVRMALQREGYRVHWAADGRGALDVFRTQDVDLVLLDIMLPGISGLEICRAIRQVSTLPIIMITAKGSEADKVRGLELGADDYLAKPFGMRELVARVRALLRRAAPGPASSAGERPIVVGPLQILPRQRQVLRRGEPVELRRREFDLLLFLARNPGQVFSRDVLLERVWGHDFEGEPRTVDVHMRMLREKLEDDPANPVLLQTVRQVGYCLRA
ncbi:MAG TPA: response regulator transcription factor [Dehalococcoidia bacterium]|nr:response regulator transcription factor [Dehalococcoidia bacterium]